MRAAVLSFVVNLGLSLALMKPLGTVGLAVAGTVSTVVQAWYLQRKLSRGHEGLHFRHLARDLVKVLGASLAMGVVVAGGWAGWILLVPASKAADAIGLAILIGGGVAVYAGLLWMLRIEGRDELAEIFAKLRQKLT